MTNVMWKTTCRCRLRLRLQHKPLSISSWYLFCSPLYKIHFRSSSDGIYQGLAYIWIWHMRSIKQKIAPTPPIFLSSPYPCLQFSTKPRCLILQQCQGIKILDQTLPVRFNLRYSKSPKIMKSDCFIPEKELAQACQLGVTFYHIKLCQMRAKLQFCANCSSQLGQDLAGNCYLQ